MAPNFKGIKFGRRKSSANLPDDAAVASPARPVSSFRVIPRDDNVKARKSTGNALDLRKTATSQPTRQSSYEYDSGSSNRGSNSSASTLPQHLFENVNPRFSSASTLHSTQDAVRKDRTSSPGLPILEDDFDSGFGDIFGALNTRQNGQLEDQEKPAARRHFSKSGSAPNLFDLPTSNSHSGNPQPLGYGKTREIASSPLLHWDKSSSTDQLIESPDPSGPASPTDDVLPPPPPKHQSPGRGSKSYTYFQLEEPSDFVDEPPPPALGHTTSVRSQSSYTRSGADEDADAMMVRQSVRAVRASTLGLPEYSGSPLARNEMHSTRGLAPPTPRALNSSDTSLKTSSSSSSLGAGDRQPLNLLSPPPTPQERLDSARSTPKAAKSPSDLHDEDSIFGADEAQVIQQVHNRNLLGLPSASPRASPQRPAAARVMSMAEFEMAKKRPTQPKRSQRKDDSGSDDDYEDEDDDPVIQAQKRRIEQAKDAQHAVWRQKMKKAIGDHSTMPMRPGLARGNQSAPSLLFNGEAQAAEEDEDDEVPLAILQAHGFPSKGKAADPRQSQQSFTTISDRPGTPTRLSQAGQRASQLPVFARRLPEDPYFGTQDLAAPSIRESMNFTTPRSQSVYGFPSGPPPGSSPVPGLPPGGLVGVIAEEERQRGVRRGSPNAGGAMGYNMPGQGNVGGALPLQPMPPMLQMGQDAIRNQQMLELMQQNSFMMKEMMEMRAQMQAFQFGAPSGMPMPGLPGPGSRPMSVAAGMPADRRSVAPSTMYGRTTSFVGPPANVGYMSGTMLPGGIARSVRNVSSSGNLGGTGFGPASGLPAGYSPSIAPSERSNVGQPSRYKPVNFGDGGSTITAASHPRLSEIPPPSPAEKKKGGFLSAVVHSGRKSMLRASGETEEEEQWGAKKKRR